MSKESDELYRSLFLFFLLLVLLGLFSCEPKVQIVEKEIIKAIDIERDILDKLATHTTLDTLDYSFINLEKFVKKCFKEHNKK